MMLLINIDLFIYAYFSDYNMEKFIYASWNLDEGWWVFVSPFGHMLHTSCMLWAVFWFFFHLINFVRLPIKKKEGVF